MTFVANPQQSVAAEARKSKVEEATLPVLLLCTALTYLWNLSNNGWGNPYYAAAAQSGADSIEGLFFASSDLAGALSVDKPPLHTMVLALSVWLFGLNPWSVLAPSAIMGMASMGLVYSIIRGSCGYRAAIISCSLLLVSPVAVLMFRFNNPDTTLMFLWCFCAYLTMKAAQKPSFAAFTGIGLLLGLSFLTKQFQALILAPALLAAIVNRDNISSSRHWFRMSAAPLTGTILVGIWLLLTELTPASQRPWIGGSSANSATELTFGYNGLGRLTGLQSLGAINPKGYEGVVGADAGPLRLFGPNFAPEISWFLVPAILGFGITVHRLLTEKKMYRSRSLEKLMVTWFFICFLIVSLMTGNVHPYYSLMLVPPTCFLSSVAIGYFSQGTETLAGRRMAALSTSAAAFMTWVFLSRYDYLGILANFVICSSLIASAILVTTSLWRRWKFLVGPFVAISLLIAPLTFDVVSIETPQQGSFPQSGPVPSVDTWYKRNADQLAAGQREIYALMRGEPTVPAVAELIRQTPSSVLWPGLTVGGENAALYQLETGRAVIAIGGFSGSDNFPAVETLKSRVERGEVGYYIHQPGVMKWGPSSQTIGLTVRWILDRCQPVKVEHLNIYDLRKCAT